MVALLLQVITPPYNGGHHRRAAGRCRSGPPGRGGQGHTGTCCLQVWRRYLPCHPLTCHYSIPRAGYSQSLSLLCREGGNLYLKNRGGFTPLHLCCQVQHTIALHCTSLTIFRQGTTSAAGCCSAMAADLMSRITSVTPPSTPLLDTDTPGSPGYSSVLSVEQGSRTRC